MTDVEPEVVVTRPATSGRRALRHGRGEMIDVVTPAHGSSMDIHVNELRAGAGPGPYHLHTSAENVFVVLEGQVVFRLDGEDHLTGPGDSVFIPPGVPHSVSPVGDDPARILEIYSPAEPDFIPVAEGGSP